MNQRANFWRFAFWLVGITFMIPLVSVFWSALGSQNDFAVLIGAAGLMALFLWASWYLWPLFEAIVEKLEKL